jgi:hypothetical protein
VKGYVGKGLYSTIVSKKKKKMLAFNWRILSGNDTVSVWCNMFFRGTDEFKDPVVFLVWLLMLWSWDQWVVWVEYG